MSKLSIDPENISAEDAEEIIRLANIIYFRKGVFDKTRWMGVPTAKCPMDMWIYQELLFGLKTDLLIETGTLAGGSALYFAQLFDMLGRGKVVSIDIQQQAGRPQHPRIEYITGSSLDPEVLKQVQERVDIAKSVTVILDADHKADFKLKELRAYHDFVSVGNYLIAEDSCFDHYPAWPEFGPGPATAVQQFVAEAKQFRADRSAEKHLITFAPMAFLKRLRK